MLRFISIAILAAAIAAPAIAQPAKSSSPVTQTVFLNAFNDRTSRFSGFIMAAAQPCPGVNISVNIGVNDVKDEAEAKAQAAAEVSKIQDSVDRQAQACKH